jgi:uncharacterized protein (DUF1810 family)
MKKLNGDPFQLQRFIDVQDPELEGVRSELREGRKRGHWMWFIFPQLRGLGSSSTANYFGISSRAEAEAYLEHPVLGQRLRECTLLVNSIEGRSAEAIFGGIDAMKFRSSMTLFHEVGRGPVFGDALEKYFAGKADRLTLELLGVALKDCAEPKLGGKAQAMPHE